MEDLKLLNLVSHCAFVLQKGKQFAFKLLVELALGSFDKQLKLLGLLFLRLSNLFNCALGVTHMLA